MNSNLLTIQERGQAILKAFLEDDPRNMDLIKGGQGSGRKKTSISINKNVGKIISRTDSKKPIYSHKRALDYKDFTGQDHTEAMLSHMFASSKGTKNNNWNPKMSKHHKELSEEHRNLSNWDEMPFSDDAHYNEWNEKRKNGLKMNYIDYQKMHPRKNK